jgi:hypothetical protein
MDYGIIGYKHISYLDKQNSVGGRYEPYIESNKVWRVRLETLIAQFFRLYKIDQSSVINFILLHANPTPSRVRYLQMMN